VWILDQLNERALRLSGPDLHPSGSTGPLPPDAEDLAVSSDGRALATFSPLRSRVFVVEAGATREVPVPRALDPVVALAFGVQRQLLVATAYQETFPVGSPAAPRSEPSVFAAKREGAAFLADGTGVQVLRRTDGRPEVILVRAGSERTVDVGRRVLNRTVHAARVVGAGGGVACLRLEHEAGAVPLRVRREAVCMEAATGRIVLDRALPDPGSNLPRRELAMGGGRLAFIHPENNGLRVVAWSVPGGAP